MYDTLTRNSLAAARAAMPPSTAAKTRARKSPRIALSLPAQLDAHPDLTLAALQAWLFAEHAVRLSNGAMWSAVARLGLSFKKDSARASKTARMSPRGAASGRRRGRLSIPTSSSLSTRLAPAPR